MRKWLCAILPVLGLLAAPALADFYVAGDFNGWSPNDPAYQPGFEEADNT